MRIVSVSACIVLKAQIRLNSRGSCSKCLGRFVPMLACFPCRNICTNSTVLHPGNLIYWMLFNCVCFGFSHFLWPTFWKWLNERCLIQKWSPSWILNPLTMIKKMRIFQKNDAHNIIFTVGWKKEKYVKNTIPATFCYCLGYRYSSINGWIC